VNNLPDKTLVLVPHRLFSLWDIMVELKIKDIITTLEFLRAVRTIAEERFPQEKDVFENLTRNLMNHVVEMSNHAQRLDLIETKGRCNNFANELFEIVTSFPKIWDENYNPCDILPPEAISREVDGIEKTLRKELEDKKFVYVPSSEDEFFEQPHLFGEIVTKAFPSAATDIKDAGNCLALGLKTAAVFHSMRVAEHGLRILAQSPYLDITLTFPIEFATWGNVIEAIDKKLKPLKITPKTTAREEELRFYSGLLASARAIQILWRDPVSHIRARFDKPKEAENALRDIHRFMETLAEKLTE
jgi:hypothetical protein